jgi:hypothetical protein
MPEWRMPEVMRQRNRLSQLRSQAACQQWFLGQQVVCDGPGELGGFNAVGQTRPVEISLTDAKDLSLSLESAKCRAVQYPVSIALSRVPVVFE